MKKHIIGFAIFSFIVVSAVFVRFYFYVPDSFDVPAPAVNNSCWKIKRDFSSSKTSIVRQALLNLKTKQITWEVYVPETETPFALHFFIKESGRVRYLGSEVAPIVSSSYNKNVSYNSSYLWLYDLQSYDNMYIVPEMISISEYENKTFNPVFDETRATPVTIYSGKTDFKASNN